MILATLDHYDSVVSNYVTATGVPFLSVDYRLAPESQGEALAEDAFAGVVWLRAHATKLGVALDRIAIMGDSAGGGIAAGAAILARDRAIELTKQILIYPMLDDRNVEPITTLESLLTWTYDDNYTGWSAMLGSDFVTERVSPIAAPARLQDFKALPPVYIEVGELDIFREEDIRYALHLMNAGVPTELHVHPGAPHGFDRIAPTAELTRRAFNDRSRVIQSI
jgi:acetyl esterase/lipase